MAVPLLAIDCHAGDIVPTEEEVPDMGDICPKDVAVLANDNLGLTVNGVAQFG